MKSALFSIALCLFLAACSSSTKLSTQSIQSDPDWLSGQLENGVKYHIYPNEHAPVSLRFIVHTGSLNETSQQAGYAHFIEHMAFNGSQHFSANQIIKQFEQSGAAFGADINASTSYRNTIYKLDLPDDKSLDKSMTWFRDIADGLTLSKQEIDKERGVILGEYRMNRPKNKPFSTTLYQHMIDPTILKDHDALGSIESINSVTANGLKQYYQKWYQPQNSEIIITGNIDPSAATALIKKHFSSWQSTDSSQLKTTDNLAYSTHNIVEHIGAYDSSSMGLLFEMSPSRWVTLGDQTFYWRDNVALQLIQQRLHYSLIDHGLSIQQQYVGDYWLEGKRYALIQLGFSEQDRNALQDQMLSVLASLRDHGVSQPELNSIISGFQQTFDNIDQNWEKQTAVDHANGMTNAITQNQVPQSKLDYKNNLAQFITQTDLTLINHHLYQLLSQPSVFALGMEDTTALPTPVQVLKAQFAKRGSKPIFVNEDSHFNQPQTIGSIVDTKLDPKNPDMTIFTLSNGLEVWYLRDKKAGKQVNMVYAGLGGKAALEPELFPAYELAIPTIVRSGIGQLNAVQFSHKLKSNNIHFEAFSTYTDQWIAIDSPKNSLSESFSALYTALTDIRVSEVQLNAVKKENIQAKKTFLLSPVGPIAYQAENDLFLPSSYRHLLQPPAMEAVTTEQIKQVHQTLFTQNRNNTLVIIANLDNNQLTPLLRQYAANFPLDPAKSVRFNPHFNTEASPRLTSTNNSENTALVVSRVLNTRGSARSTKAIFMEDMLSRIIQQRLTQVIREDMGLDYTPNVISFAIDGEQYSDWILSAWCDPKQADVVSNAMKDIINQLKTGITAQETLMVGKQLQADLAPLSDDQKQYALFIKRYLIHGYDYNQLQQPEKLIQTISAQDLSQHFERQFGGSSLWVDVLLTPHQ
ncbi:insulinase family protein [Vibrio sp. S11_S32]|uniref:M16 family metallopeptidase n=1 Tax=Vibrio sp. S11_S32 TaxID=2720225 RepID=UPI0016815EAF|nr:M16 family metallopeptidase [Vibrio sp. S11_S32]MBD1577242.1 insulinase family protein [Vibrio sp. S11_S32]